MWATYEKSPGTQKIRVRVNVKLKKWKFWDMGSNKWDRSGSAEAFFGSGLFFPRG
jgi:hypothetical protein